MNIGVLDSCTCIHVQFVHYCHQKQLLHYYHWWAVKSIWERCVDSRSKNGEQINQPFTSLMIPSGVTMMVALPRTLAQMWQHNMTGYLVSTFLRGTFEYISIKHEHNYPKQDSQWRWNLFGLQAIFFCTYAHHTSSANYRVTLVVVFLYCNTVWIAKNSIIYVLLSDVQILKLT